MPRAFNRYMQWRIQNFDFEVRQNPLDNVWHTDELKGIIGKVYNMVT